MSGAARSYVRHSPAAGGRLDVLARHRRQVVRADPDLDQGKPWLAMRRDERLTQLVDALDTEAPPAPCIRQVRVGPCGELEQLRARDDRAEDLPASVVDQEHDGAEPVARRVRNLRPRHLKGAIPAEDERAESRA